MNKLTKIVTTAGAAGALILATVPAAFAGTDAYAYVNNANNTYLAADVHFISNGDDFSVCDTLRDGYDVKLQGYRPDGTYFERFLTTGVGTCYTYRFDFTENRTIKFGVCTIYPNTQAVVRCGPWGYGES